MATSSAEETLVIPRQDIWEQISTGSGFDSPYIVILYNCDCHTFEQVIRQMQKATGCTREKGEAVAYEVDSRGRAVVFSGSQVECERVAGVLAEIGLQVETDRTA